jgi:hypothetical protein
MMNIIGIKNGDLLIGIIHSNFVLLEKEVKLIDQLRIFNY